MTDSHKKLLHSAGIFVRRLFMGIGVMAVIAVVLLFMTVSHFAGRAPEPESLPRKIILSFTFDSSLVETAGKPSFGQPLFDKAPTVHDVIDALDSGARDERVKGFIATIADPRLSIAQMQELRAAVKRFRDAGKFTYVFSESYGGAGSGLGDYFLASSFADVWLQPVGTVSFGGIALEMPFFKGTFDQLGLEAQFLHKGIYKSAPESLTQNNMSAPNREMMAALVIDLTAQVVVGVADARDLSAKSVRRFLDRGLFSDKSALTADLIDHIGYYDEVKREAFKNADIDIRKDDTVDVMRYVASMRPQPSQPGIASLFKSARGEKEDREKTPGPKIALIYGVGGIVPYDGEGSAFGEDSMAAEKIVSYFKEAREDEGVVAVVFRIDSPGGSASAAESIRRAVVQTKRAGKPVVVSMGGYAASGGYWVATPASRIIAQDGTITGSIGVFGGKIVAEKMWKKIGVNWESVSVGEKARMWSMNKGFSEGEKLAFDEMLETTYSAFIDRVMEGRTMTRLEAQAVAQGRVFTGRQAREKGLVDEIGGIDLAITRARELAKVDPKEKVAVEVLPAVRSPLEKFLSMASGDASAFFAPSINISGEALLRGLQRYGSASDDVLRMPAFQLKE